MGDPAPRRMTEADIESAAGLQVETFGSVRSEAINELRAGSRWSWRDAWVIGEPDEIRALAIAIPFRWWFRGQVYPISGIASVAVRAVDRRRGLASALVRAIVCADREAGRSASLLYPFQHGFYRRLGYGSVGLMHYWRIPTAQLVTDTPARQAVRGIRPADRPAICELHQRWLTSRGGLARSAERWERRWREGGEQWVVFEATAGLQGYLAYRSVDRAIEVRELIAETAEASRGLWAFLGAQVEQRAEVRYHAPLDEPVWASLREPLMFEAANRGFVVSDAAALTVSGMARLIDVVAALKTRAFPNDLAGGLSVDVSDPVLAPAGEALRITFDTGRASVQAHTGPADARCDIACFSQLFCGALSADRARWYGLLEGADEDVRLLDRAFPPGPPYLLPADWF
jgi:predicted acetyltransferase